VQVRDPHDEDFGAAASQQMNHALNAVRNSADTAGLCAAIASAAAFRGCVHMMIDLQVATSPAAALAGVDPQQQVAQFEQHIRAQIQQKQRAQPDAVQVSVAVTALPPAGYSSSSWQQLPWAALLSPVCITATSASSGPQQSTAGAHSVRLGLLPTSTQELPEAPRVLVSGYATAAPALASSAAATSRTSSICALLSGQQVWIPAAAAAGRRVLSITLPQQAAAGVSVVALGLLPAAAARDSSNAGSQDQQGQAVHPVVTPLLLCLPEHAAEEVLQLFTRMVDETVDACRAAAGGREPGLDEATAARCAYWRHYVPFSGSWRSLLAAVAAAEQRHAAGSTVDEAAAAAGALSPDTLALSAAALAGKAGPSPAAVQETVGLLAFLACQRMPACLKLALALVQRAQLAELVVQACPRLAMLQKRSCQPDGHSQQGRAQTQHPGAATQQRQQQQQQQQVVHQAGYAADKPVADYMASNQTAAPAVAQAPSQPATQPMAAHKAAADVAAVPAAAAAPSVHCWHMLLAGYPYAGRRAAHVVAKQGHYISRADGLRLGSALLVSILYVLLVKGYL
jgi:hypothetical protein